MNVMIIFDVVIAIFGVYMAVSSLLMKKNGKIDTMVLAKEELPKVRDVKGFIAFIYWRELAFGIMVAAVGVLGILNETVISIGKLVVVEVILFLAAFIWFQNSLAKARQKFL